MDKMDYFLEIYGALPRAGPGSNECTKRAFGLMKDIPESPRILDIGCGPGVQTVELLKLSGGKVLALDFLPLMIERTKSNAEIAKVSKRLEVLQQDMNQMAFPPNSFDVIWSEGAIYNLGFENGLRKIKNFVKPGGYVAVSEAVWLKPNPPDSLVDFWKQYPEIDNVDNKLAVIDSLDYQQVEHFVLPDDTWIAEYYAPMEDLIARKEKEWSAIPEAMEVLKEAVNEIEFFRKYSSYYGYVFFVMRYPDA
ncbi:MAG: class I SAM-dependent methyltransferase [Pseudomonadales bacterium]|nr:class I SAM-dependent methyltransferase [Pseudomonadales bacterium]